jgi:hypothetical protein
MRDAMQRSGTRPEIIYAYQKTGRIVTKESLASLAPDERAEWDAAIDEYFRLEKDAGNNGPQ